MKNKVVSRRQFAAASVFGLGGAALSCLAQKGVAASAESIANVTTPIMSAVADTTNIAGAVKVITAEALITPNEAVVHDLNALVSPFKLHKEVVGATLLSIEIDEHNRGVLTLKDRSGNKFLVDITRQNTTNTQHEPIFQTKQYNLYLRNGAKGNTRTNERQGLAVMALGDVIRFNENNSVPLPLISKEKQWALEKKRQA